MDLKPDNVLIKNKTECKVADFGISKLFKTNPDEYEQSQGGLVSMWAASPEVIKEEKYGRAQDTWSLGCILYFMCTNKHPFGEVRD